MAIGDAFKAALTKAGLDAARESAVALAAALQAAEAAAAELNKRGPMTPQEAATAEVKRLSAEARKATAEVNALERAQARMAASGARAAGQQAKTDWKAINSFSSGTKGGSSPWASGAGVVSPKMPAGGVKPGQRAADAAAKDPEKEGGSAFKAPKDLKYILKHAGIGKAAMGAMGAAAGLELTKLALGYRGMAYLGAISQRTGMQVRQLFTGVNPMPVVKAADHFSQLFNKATATGGAISGIFTRVFNSLFGGVEKAEPLFFAFAEGMVGAALTIEGAYLEARLALMPFTDAIQDMLPSMDAVEIAATAGGVALTGIGVAAAYAARAALPMTVAIMAVVAALEQLAKLKNEIASAGGLGAAAKQIGRHFIEGTGEDAERAAGARGRAAYDQAEENKRRNTAVAPGVTPAGGVATAGGEAAGAALPAGMVKGMDAGGAAVEAAGRRLGERGVAGARAGADAHSPSRKTAKLGDDMAEGDILGMRRREGDVAAAAREVLAPDVAAKGQGRAPAAGGSVVVDMSEVVALLRELVANTRPRSSSSARGGGWPEGVHTVASILGVDHSAAAT